MNKKPGKDQNDELGVLETLNYLMYWRLEAADVLNRHIVILTE